ncbi:hypothetical protein KIN20_001203 [Parelaphostrongylus tenuis]|uniref:Uncharacterized protein n=1 Tax=Parelaphostrongylus tenuis TaxID=148309 RepID=A0AAD5MLU7_PARTN|nr:hypothetical protein KIN20_001203 [Parelaphostrongylus tenuis]
MDEVDYVEIIVKIPTCSRRREKCSYVIETHTKRAWSEMATNGRLVVRTKVRSTHWIMSTNRLAGTCEFADHFGVTPCNSPAGGQPPSVPPRLHRVQQNSTYAIAVVGVINAHNASD